MSPIGRIFIVVNLVLAAAFLGWASNALSTTEDWKARAEKAKADMDAAVAEKESEITDLQQAKNNADEQSRRFREERDRLDQEVNQLRGQNTDQKSRNDSLAADLTAIQAKLSDFNDTISQLEAAKDRALQRAQEAERDRDQAQDQAQKAELARRDAVDGQGRAEQEIRTLTGQKESLTAQLSQLETQMATIVAQTGINVSDVTAVPKIDASVLDVRLDLEPGLVMLNVGQRQEVKPGFTFEIYQGNVYKGQVRVQNVQDNVCSALIVHAVPGKRIGQGDRASTRL